jgi:hypothetical protein
MYRRINPAWYVDDDEGRRVTSQAFQDLGGSMSVALGVVLRELGLEPEIVVESYEGFGLMSLSVGFVRSLSLGVVREPTEVEPWHGAVHGTKSRSIRSKLAQHGQWVRLPRG